MTKTKSHWKFIKDYSDSFVIFSANGEPIGLPLSYKIIESPSQQESTVPNKIPILDPASITSSELQTICWEADLPHTWIKGVISPYLNPYERKHFTVRETLDRYYSSLTPGNRKVFKSQIEGLIRKGNIDSSEKLDPFATRTVKQIADDPTYPFTESSLRYWIYHAAENQLQPAIKRLGRKILIDVNFLRDWVCQHSGVNQEDEDSQQEKK